MTRLLVLALAAAGLSACGHSLRAAAGPTLDREVVPGAELSAGASGFFVSLGPFAEGAGVRLSGGVDARGRLHGGAFLAFELAALPAWSPADEGGGVGVRAGGLLGTSLGLELGAYHVDSELADPGSICFGEGKAGTCIDYDGWRHLGLGARAQLELPHEGEGVPRGALLFEVIRDSRGR